MSALLVALLATPAGPTPIRGAETLPDDTWAAHVAGGLAFVDIEVPVVPFLPLLTADLEVGYGLHDRVDLRGRYITKLGIQHRLGPALRVRAVEAGGWSLGAEVFPSGMIQGAYEEEVDTAGDVATGFNLLTTWRGRYGAITLEGGATVEWLLYEEIEASHLDTTPYLAWIDVAVEAEYPYYDDVNLTLRVDMAIPTAPDDPFTVLGGYPRVLFGGNFVL